MITPFFRSSLLNSFELCQLRSFIEYSIGLRGESNLSALIGSTVHGVMELLALAKLAHQQCQGTFTHESFPGRFDTERLMDAGNIDSYIRISYDYYNKESPGIFIEDSYKECQMLTMRALSYCNGAFDPRSYDMYAAELPFEIEIKESWARYSYVTPDGNEISGNLCLKGTIDVVYNDGDGVLHCLDYKTSKAANDWASGKTKVADRVPKNKNKETSLYNDQQMMLYYYVLANTFPDKDIIMTLYFIRINKAFTMVFDRKRDLPRIHAWLRERFEYIKSVEKPSFIDGTENGWKCRFCPFSKNKQSGTRLSVCRFYQTQFRTKSMNEIMLANANYDIIGSYGAGGSTKERE